MPLINGGITLPIICPFSVCLLFRINSRLFRNLKKKNTSYIYFFFKRRRRLGAGFKPSVTKPIKIKIFQCTTQSPHDCIKQTSHPSRNHVDDREPGSEECRETRTSCSLGSDKARRSEVTILLF